MIPDSERQRAPLTVGSLFSGIGGLDLGLEWAGWQVRWQVENDPYCVRVLTKHWPDVPKYGDIRTVDWTQVAPVTLLAGGFPCQPFSLAGKRQGSDDERYLWPEFVRAIRYLRPRLVLAENVPGLLVHGLGDVLRDVAALGFDAEWSVLSACAVGAPHTRERVFLVAYANSEPGFGQRWRQQCAVPSAPERHVYPQWRQPEPDRVADGVPYRVDRLRALGNAVVPPVAQWLGERLRAALAQERAVATVVVGARG